VAIGARSLVARGDLTAWATSAAADPARPEGRLFLLAVITSIPSTPQAQAVWYRSLPRVT